MCAHTRAVRVHIARFKKKRTVPCTGILALAPRRDAGSRLSRCVHPRRSRRSRRSRRQNRRGPRVVVAPTDSCCCRPPPGPTVQVARRAAQGSLTEKGWMRAMRGMPRTRGRCSSRTRPTWQRRLGACVALRAWRSRCSSACRRVWPFGTLDATPSAPTECRPWHHRLRHRRPHRPLRPRLRRRIRPRRLPTRRVPRHRPARRGPSHRRRHRCSPGTFTRRRSSTRF